MSWGETEVAIFTVSDAQGRVRVVWKSPDPWRLVSHWWRESRERRYEMTSFTGPGTPAVAWMTSLKDDEEPTVTVVEWVQGTLGGEDVRRAYASVRSRYKDTVLSSGPGGAREGAGRKTWKQSQE